MKRTLLVASVLALATLAGCGNAPAPAANPPAPISAAASGVPALSGTPTDLTKPTKASAGGGRPPTELLLQDIVKGTGPAATLADTVDVRYTGTLYADGSLFDTSWSGRNTPATFPLDGVVPGFAQGIEGMQPGGRRVIVIPPELGYGAQANGSIPGGSTLVFVVDLVGLR